MKSACLLVVILCCGGCGGGSESSGDLGANGPGCPSAAPPAGSSCDKQLRCGYAGGNGNPVHCNCEGSRWLCNDCPWEYPETVAFACQTSCHMETSEWSISCPCDVATHQGICCGSDALDDFCPSRITPGSFCCGNPKNSTGSCPEDAAADAAARSCTCGADGRWSCN